ncbi:hypothetical protein ACVIN2_003265 [Bradyrhizobium sp. USDA 3650]
MSEAARKASHPEPRSKWSTVSARSDYQQVETRGNYGAILTQTGPQEFIARRRAVPAIGHVAQSTCRPRTLGRRHRRTVTASACSRAQRANRAIARCHGSIGANIVSVSIVATAAVRSSAKGSRADRCRSYTVAPIAIAAIATTVAVAPVACAAHCDSAAAPRSSNCDRTAAITAATPIGTSAAPSLGIIGNQAGGEQNESGKRSKNEAEHDRNPSMNSLSPAREIAALSAREVDVDQSIPRIATPTLCSAAPEAASVTFR